MSKKSDTIESGKRFKQILDWYSEGYSRPEMIQFASEKWKISTRAVDAYIHKATKFVEETNSVSNEEVARLIYLNQWRLYRTSLEVVIEKDKGKEEFYAKTPNLGTARMILMDMAKMRGLVDSKADKDKEAPKDSPASKLTDTQLEAALEALKCSQKS